MTVVERRAQRVDASRQRGFTLIELMVVVAIAGVMAVIGLMTMNKHVTSSRNIEATAMVQSIRAAQERYRALTGIYLNVSRDGEFYPREPSGAAAESKVAFFQAAGGDAPDNERWAQLGPTVAGPVQYGYMTKAGLPGEAMPALQIPIDGVELPDAPTEPWYVIEAIGDVDGDEVPSYFFATSFNAQVYSKDPDE